MPASQFTASDFEFKPVTLSIWNDFVSLFTEPGIQNGCWCMYWRLRRADDQLVWSITCFFITKPYRRQGMTENLICAALDYARQHSAQIVEAYPLRTEITKLLPYERYMGIQSTFERLGFAVVAQRSQRRPVMRCIINHLG